MTTAGVSGTYLYNPPYGAQGAEEYSAFDAGLSAADSVLTSAGSATQIYTSVYATSITATGLTAASISATTISPGTNIYSTTITANTIKAATNIEAVKISATSITAADLSAASVELVGVTSCVGLSATAVTASNLSAGSMNPVTLYATTITATNLTASTVVSTNLTASNDLMVGVNEAADHSLQIRTGVNNSPQLRLYPYSGYGFSLINTLIGSKSHLAVMNNNGDFIFRVGPQNKAEMSLASPASSERLISYRSVGVCGTTNGTQTSAAFITVTAGTSAIFVEANVTAICTAGAGALSGAAYKTYGAFDHGGARMGSSVIPLTASAHLSAYTVGLCAGTGTIALAVIGSAGHSGLWGYDLVYSVLG